MSNILPKNAADIDLLKILEVLWNGKWKITFMMFFCLSIAIVWDIFKPKTFITTTEIKHVSQSESSKYALFNSATNIFKLDKIDNKNNYKDEWANGDLKNIKLNKNKNESNFFNITKDFLMKSYIEQILEGSLLKTAIEKKNLFKKEDFDSEADYQEFIEKFASDIKIKPFKKNGIKIYKLEAKYFDKNKWKNFISFLDKEANSRVKKSIIDNFKLKISIENQKKNFAIKDLEIKIDNVKKDYEVLVRNRIAFLSEQAAIASKLGIQKNTRASQQSFRNEDSVLFGSTNSLFYLRGYQAIEEEIKQIKTRTNKDFFMKDLYKIEQIKRDLEQDKTIERSVYLFNNTPLLKESFRATIVKVSSTDFKSVDNRILNFILSIILGGILGVAYVLIINNFKNYKNNMSHS